MIKYVKNKNYVTELSVTEIGTEVSKYYFYLKYLLYSFVASLYN